MTEERTGADRTVPDALVERVLGRIYAISRYICNVDADIVRIVLAAPFDADHHVYWSTACLHGRHEYCACDVGLTGDEKAPHTCKWCPAQCICPCHVEEVDGG